MLSQHLINISNSKVDTTAGKILFGIMLLKEVEIIWMNNLTDHMCCAFDIQ